MPVSILPFCFRGPIGVRVRSEVAPSEPLGDELQGLPNLGG